MIDLYFHYLYTMRFFLVSRLFAINNIMALPYLSKVLIFFSIKDLTFAEDPCIYNYFYLLRFFFGRKAFVTRYRSYFHLRQTFYSFDIYLILRGANVFFPVIFYINDIHRFLSIRGFHSYFYNPCVFSLIIWDTNIFTEKKTNLGLFNLKHPLHYRFFVANGDFISTKLFLRGLKLRLRNTLY